MSHHLSDHLSGLQNADSGKKRDRTPNQENRFNVARTLLSKITRANLVERHISRPSERKLDQTEQQGLSSRVH